MPTAKAIMARKLITLYPDLGASEAMGLLEKHRISGAPVVGQDERLEGVISVKDLAHGFDPAVPAGGADFYLRWPQAQPTLERVSGSQELRVRDLMHPPITVSHSASLEDVARTMLAHGIHRVLVTEDDRLVGLISALDFVRLHLADPVEGASPV